MSGEDSSDTQSDDDEPSNDSTSSSVASITKDSSFNKRKLSTDNDRALVSDFLKYIWLHLTSQI